MIAIKADRVGQIVSLGAMHHLQFRVVRFQDTGHGTDIYLESLKTALVYVWTGITPCPLVVCRGQEFLRGRTTL